MGKSIDTNAEKDHHERHELQRACVAVDTAMKRKEHKCLGYNVRAPVHCCLGIYDLHDFTLRSVSTRGEVILEERKNKTRDNDSRNEGVYLNQKEKQLESNIK